MEQFKQFNVNKEKLLVAFSKLEAVLHTLQEVGLDVTDDLNKVKSSIESVNSEVLRIAMLGAFSDGKTSVVAAWLGKIMDDMKIDSDESSDQLAFYYPKGLPEQCEIVDTPGLFGDKEKEIDGKDVLFEDITKKYISEAHIIFYVVDAANPLKESHNNIARWVLRDLNKLTSTVFVINKMDSVTNLTKDDAFAEMATIKTNNLVKKLKAAASLSDVEINELKIVCIAAEFGNKGLEACLTRPDYETRSRIGNLRELVNDVLIKTVPTVLVAKTGMDVLQQILREKIQLAENELAAMGKNIEQSKQEIDRLKEDIDSGKKEIQQSANLLRDDCRNLEKNLLGELRSAAFEDLVPFLEDHIGYVDKDNVGFKLSQDIQSRFYHFFENTASISKGIESSILKELEARESFFASVSKASSGGVSNLAKGISKIPVDKIRDGIVAARDVVTRLTGLAYKFKPWEAGKLAGTISKSAAPIGAAISLLSDLWSAYDAHKQEEKLRDIKSELSKSIKEIFLGVYEELPVSSAELCTKYAPQIIEYQAIVDSLKIDLENLKTIEQKLKIVRSEIDSFGF